MLGESGVGKTSVALRLATPDTGLDVVPCVTYLDTSALHDALIERVRARRWERRLVDAPSLVLDGPVWLQNRPAAVEYLQELLVARLQGGRRTVVCQSNHDCSVNILMGAFEAGSLAVIGLRYPKGQRGRIRFARRACDELQIPRTAARGTEELEPWGYEAVVEYLHAWRRRHLPAAPVQQQVAR